MTLRYDPAGVRLSCGCVFIEGPTVSLALPDWYIAIISIMRKRIHEFPGSQHGYAFQITRGDVVNVLSIVYEHRR